MLKFSAEVRAWRKGKNQKNKLEIINIFLVIRVEKNEVLFFTIKTIADQPKTEENNLSLRSRSIRSDNSPDD